MFILFFICWVIFNQAFTLEIAIFGIAISLLMYLFVCKIMGWSFKKDLLTLGKLFLIIGYILALFWEILKANVNLYKIFFSKQMKTREPVVVKFTTKLRTRTARVFLANAITLTPGTITVSLEGHELTVHCFDKSLAKGLNDTIFEKKLMKIEEGFENE